MSTKLAKILADFRTSLATELPVAGTSATLQSATDDDGVALPAGAYLFTIDGRNSQKEYIACTLSGTTISNVYSVSRQGVQTSGAVRKHRIGASVVITDWAQLKYMSDLLEGTTGFNASVPLSYDGNPTFTLDAHIISKKYADDLAIAGAPIGSHLLPGIFLKATTVETIAGTDTNGTYTYVIPVGLTKSTTAGAADEGKVPLLNATGVLDQTFINSPRTWTQIQTFAADNLQITTDADSANDPVRYAQLQALLSRYGDGSDGAFASSSGTTTLNDATKTVYQHTSFALTGTAILTYGSNNQNRPVFIYVQNDLTVTSATAKALNLDGFGAPGGAGGTGNGQAGGGGTSGATSRLGGVGNAGSGAASYGPSSGHGGGGGGGGGLGNAGAAGTAATAAGGVGGILSVYLAGTPTRILREGFLGGGGGGGASGMVFNNQPGGAGGAGGNGGGSIIFIVGGNINITSEFSAAGAAGSAGASLSSQGGGGGGGGGGGLIAIFYAGSVTANTATSAVAGGGGGAGANSGGAGGAGGAGQFIVRQIKNVEA